MFNWETEDSVDWDALESQQKLPGSNEPSRRWIWVLLLGVVLVGSAAAIIWRRVSTTLEETQLRIENDVLASVTIVHQTAQTQDSDLFTIFLSGKDSAWALAQERALRQNEMFARDALGMSWRPADSVDDAVLDFAPDLHSAQVTLTQTYDIDIGNGLTETAVLTQTAVYRLGPNRWLLSPPEAAFWGETRTYNGSLLSTTYFARDGSVARRLGRDLDDFLLTLCAEVDSGGCPPGLRVEAVLTGQSASFSEIIRLGPENGSVFRFAPFPSPTVAGWPTDELSYEALYRGYATVLGYFFLNEVVLEGYGGDNPFYHALRAELLWRTGIRPFTPPQLPRPPKTVSDLVPLDGLASLWRDTYTLPVTEWDAVDPLAYRFVALLLDEYDSSLPLLRALYAFHDGPFEQWMQEVSSLYGLDVPTLERLWLAAQFPETAVAQNPPPIPLPDQAIAMVCQNPPQPGYELHRFDLSNDYRELIGFIVGTPSALLALPGDERFVVGANAPSGQTSTLQVWQESGVVMLRWRQAFNQPMANPLGLDPRGQLVLLGGSGGGWWRA